MPRRTCGPVPQSEPLAAAGPTASSGSSLEWQVLRRRAHGAADCRDRRTCSSAWCGGFQPDKMARSFKGDADGLYARLLLWLAGRSPPYRPLTDNVEEVEPEFQNTPGAADRPDGRRRGRAHHHAGAACRLRRARLRAVPPSTSTLERRRSMGASGSGGRRRPAHVLRLAGTLAYIDWARRTAGQPFLLRRAEPDREAVPRRRRPAGARLLLAAQPAPHCVRSA